MESLEKMGQRDRRYLHALDNPAGESADDLREAVRDPREGIREEPTAPRDRVRLSLADLLRDRSLWVWARWGAWIGGIAALIWFLVRVIPKPSRAAYPCQRAAFPVATAVVIWIFSFFGLAAYLRKARLALAESRLAPAAGFLFIALLCLGLSQSTDGTNARATYLPADPANTPVGVGRGVFPGRVVWAHDTAATTWDTTLDNHATLRYWDDDHTHQTVVDDMVSDSLRALAGADTDAAAWDAIFHSFNEEYGRGSVGYTSTQKVCIKVNHVEQRSHRGNASNTGDNKNMADLSPQMVVAVLKQLVNVVGVPEANITVADPSRFIADKEYDRCVALFPGVVFVEDNFSYPGNPVGTEGRTQSTPTSTTLLHYSGLAKNGTAIPSDPLPMCMYRADYIINLGVLKGHPQAGVTMSGKNWYGCFTHAPGDTQHNLAWMAGSSSSPTPEPAHYRCMVDLMGHKNLGGKTLLYLLDGLWGFQAHGTSSRPLKWTSPPFTGDYPSSILVSQDPVAIDSVGLDFLRAEFAANMGGAALEGAIDDYIHEAALADNPPSGTFYDPEGDGSRLASLGVHEHWNSPTEKLYSTNLNSGAGIELIPLSAVHTRATGTVRIEVEPAGLPWLLTGPESVSIHDAGSTVLLNMPTGQYTIAWEPPPDVVPPDPMGPTSLDLNTGGEIVFSVEYQSRIPPHVALTSPADGSVWAAGASIPFAADVQTTQGTILRVEFNVDGSTAHTDFDPPYEFQWIGAAQGVHIVTARVYNSVDADTESQPAQITVGYPPLDCLFVVGNATLPTGDQAIANRLARLGYQVTVIAAAASQSSDADGRDLVFISESVSSNNIAEKFRDVAVPVLCAEDYNYDEMMMTGPTVDVDYGYLWDQPVIDVAAGGSPLTGGLPPGPTTVYSATGRNMWGIPTANATIGAYVHDQPTKPVTFGYDGGAAMVGGFPAPARRTGFFLQSYTQEMTLLTPAGLVLFDAAVRWTGGDTTGTLAAPTDLAASIAGNTLALTWLDLADNEEGFELETSSDGAAYELFSLLPPDVEQVFLDAPAGAAPPVWYRVRAWNGDGVSAWSNAIRIPAETASSVWWVTF